MKKLTYILMAGTLMAGTLTACSDDNDAARGTGEVSVQIVTDNAIANTRAEMTPKQTMDLDVLNMDGGVVLSFADAASNGVSSFSLPVGTYVFHAYSAHKNNATPYFEADGNAYYEVRDTVAIAAGETRSLKLVCTLAMAKVSVNYADELKQNFQQLDCTVLGSAGQLVYAKDETRAAYYPATGNLTLQLAVTNNAGQSFTHEQTVEGIKARTHYRINYSLAENTTGTGEFTITFDPTVNEVTYNVSIPTKAAFDVTLQEPDVYGKSAYLYATSQLEDNTGLTFEYRAKSATDGIWVSASTKPATIQGETVYVGDVSNLEFDTEYEYRMAVGGTAKSEVQSFTTEPYVEVPNLNFDTWNKNRKNSKDVHYPNETAANTYWATGNLGLNSARLSSNTVPVNDGNQRNGYAPRLTTVSASIAGYAAGNIFIGDYETDYTDGAKSVKYGRSYEGARPLALKGYYKYSPVAISNTSAQYPADDSYLMDTGDIYIKLWDDWVWQYDNGEYIYNDAANLIAEGHFIPTGENTEYAEFNIPLTYLSKAKAKWITIVCASSRYGGYFDGITCVGKVGKGSILYVDDFELVYDK
jgi:hypothetical protein